MARPIFAPSEMIFSLVYGEREGPRIGPAGQIENVDDDELSDTDSVDTVIPSSSTVVTKDNGVGWLLEGKLLSPHQWRSIQQEKKLLKPTDDKYAVIAVSRILSGKPHAVLLRSKYLQALYNHVSLPLLGVTFDNEEIAFAKPFEPLFFYLDDMLDTARTGKFPNREGIPETPKDIDALVSFNNEYIKPSHDKIRNSTKGGLIKFEDLWSLFQPGEILYSKDAFGQPVLFRTSCSGYRQGMTEIGDDSDDETFKSTVNNYAAMARVMFRGDKPTRFCVDCWDIVWDHSTRTFSRKLRTMKINNYRGSRKISSLLVYPLKYFNSSTMSRESLLEKLAKRGFLWKRLASGDPLCCQYKGPAMPLEKGIIDITELDPVNLNERVVIDNGGAHRYEDPDTRHKIAYPNMKEVMNPVMAITNLFSDNELPLKPGDFDERYVDFDNSTPDSEFTPLQAQLCPSSVHCFSLASRKWYSITIGEEYLTEVRWDKEAWDHLVLDEEKKTTIKTLVERHNTGDFGRVRGDVISGKGTGLVMVLHGPPGVGKTLTAESVAEMTQRPLYSINVGEVTSEEHVRSRLHQIFSEASRWNAVLLLDEADVVLEKRSFEDIRRNGTVSIFLRMLEYYEGILFLTTNRLRLIDDAFQSRIHLAYKYEPLDHKARQKIWSGFISRLPDEEAVAKEELHCNLASLGEYKLNGRQIRNAMFIAHSIALGKYKAVGRLNLELVEQAVKQTLHIEMDFGRSDGGKLLSDGKSGPAWSE